MSEKSKKLKNKKQIKSNKWLRIQSRVMHAIGVVIVDIL